MEPARRSARFRWGVTAAVASVLAVPALPALAATPSSTAGSAATPTGTATTTSSAPTSTTSTRSTTSAATTSATATSTKATTTSAATTSAATTSKATTSTSTKAATPSTTSPTPTPTATGPKPPLTPSGQGSCQAILFYGVRGSGESASTADGLGEALGAYRQRLQQAYGASRVGSYAADYPVATVGDLSSTAAWQTSVVTTAVAAGASTVSANLVSLAAACPSSTVVLAGYDEGALVVRDAIKALGASNPSVVQRLASVVLVGDPALHYADPGFIVGGGSPWAAGVLATYVTVTELPSTLNVVHACHLQDVVCQDSGALSAHSGYAADRDAVVAQLASGLRAVGLPPSFALRARVEAPATAQAGTPATFSVVVTNVGGIANPRAGKIVVRLSGHVVDQASPTVSGEGWTCSAAQCSRSVAAGALAAGASLPVISVVNTPDVGIDFLLGTTISDVPLGGVAATNYAWDSVAVTVPAAARVVPRVTLVSRVGPTGGTRWQVQLTNVGASSSTGPVRVDLQGDGGSLVASGSGWVCLGYGTCLYVPTLAPAARSAVLLVDAAKQPGDQPPPALVRLQASVRQIGSGGLGSPVQASLTVSNAIEAAGRLAVKLTPSVTTPYLRAGSSVTWTAVVSNPSRTKPVGAVVVAGWSGDGTSAQGVFGISGSGWACSDSRCAWTGAALNPGVSASPLTFTTTVTSDARLNVTSVDVTDDPNAGLVGANAEVRLPVVVPDTARLQPTLVPSTTTPLTAGSSASWTATVVNTGAKPTVGTSQLELSLPGDLESWAVTGSGWTCAEGTCSTTQGIAAGASSTSIKITRVTGAPALTGAVSIGARAVDGAGQGWPGGQSTSSTVTFGSGRASDLAVTITGLSAPVVAGAPAKATVVVRNVGTQSMTGATVQVDGPSYWDSSFAGSGWDCSSWQSCQTTAVLAPGASAPPVTVTFTPPADGGWSQPAWMLDTDVTARLLSPSTDVDLLNNTAEAGLLVAPPAVDLVTAVAAAALPTPGSPFVATLTVHNAGKAAGTGPVTVAYHPTDSGGWPALPITSASGDGWTCSPAEYTCTTQSAVPAGGSLPPVSVTIDPSSVEDVTTSISAVELQASVTASSDQDPRSNSAFARFPVPAGGADLIGLFTPGTSAGPGGQTSAVLTLRNAGVQTAAARTELDLWGETGVGTLTARGTGWTCAAVPDSSTLHCSSDTDVAGGADLPPLTVTAPVLKDLDPYAGQWIHLGARWTNSDDHLPGNATVSADIAPSLHRVDLVPVLTGPAAPVAAGTPASPTTTTVTAAVRNAGPGAATGAIKLFWVDEGEQGQPVVAASGTGWTCVLADHVCTRAGGLAVGATTPPVTLTVCNTPGSIGNRSSVIVSVDGVQDGPTGADTIKLGYPVY